MLVVLDLQFGVEVERFGVGLDPCIEIRTAVPQCAARFHCARSEPGAACAPRIERRLCEPYVGSRLGNVHGGWDECEPATRYRAWFDRTYRLLLTHVCAHIRAAAFAFPGNQRSVTSLMLRISSTFSISCLLRPAAVDLGCRRPPRV
jgi:hypothetical protein